MASLRSTEWQPPAADLLVRCSVRHGNGDEDGVRLGDINPLIRSMIFVRFKEKRTYIALQPLLVEATRQPSVVAIGMYTGCMGVRK